jgi:hypothetical protein
LYKNANEIGLAFVKQVISHNKIHVLYCDQFLRTEDEKNANMEFGVMEEVIECRSHLLLYQGALVIVAIYPHPKRKDQQYCIVEGLCSLTHATYLSNVDDMELAVRAYLAFMHKDFMTESSGFVANVQKWKALAKSKRVMFYFCEQGLKIVLHSLKMYAFVSKFGELAKPDIAQESLEDTFLSQYKCLAFISRKLSKALWKDWKGMLEAIDVSLGDDFVRPAHLNNGVMDDYVDMPLIIKLLFLNKPSGEESIMNLKRKHVGSIKRRLKLSAFLHKITLKWLKNYC